MSRRRRLSDSDELAFYRLARHTSKDKHRPPLQDVRVVGGWAYATDSYRLLALPIDLEADGVVSTADATRGGTVDIVDPDGKFPDLGKVNQLVGRTTAPLTLTSTLIEDALRPWVGRATKTASVAWFCPPMVALPHEPALVTPDGSRHPLAGPVNSRCVQAPWLANAACALVDCSSGGGVTIHTDPNPAKAILLQPSGRDGWLNGWALVMPVRSTFNLPARRGVTA